MINNALNYALRIIYGLKSRAYLIYYRLLGVNFKGTAWLREIDIPRLHSSIELGSPIALDRGVTLLCSGDKSKTQIKIGKNTYINRNTFIDAFELISIGEDCAIGPNCYITDHDHGTSLLETPLKQKMISSPTLIGSKVWIGANVVVLKGVNIGAESIIGAGSVVTKSIPERSIAVGNPCKVIQSR